MKSEKAKEYITHATCTAQEYAERFGGRELVVSRWDVSTAIELAEQEAEERMRAKAIGAFDDMWFENGEDGEFEPDYEYHRRNFIRKLNKEDEVQEA